MRVLNYNVAYPIKNFLGNIQRLTWAGLLIIVGPCLAYDPFIEGTFHNASHNLPLVGQSHFYGPNNLGTPHVFPK